MTTSKVIRCRVDMEKVDMQRNIICPWCIIILYYITEYGNGSTSLRGVHFEVFGTLQRLLMKLEEKKTPKRCE